MFRPYGLILEKFLTNFWLALWIFLMYGFVVQTLLSHDPAKAFSILHFDEEFRYLFMLIVALIALNLILIDFINNFPSDFEMLINYPMRAMKCFIYVSRQMFESIKSINMDLVISHISDIVKGGIFLGVIFDRISNSESYRYYNI
jgi:hypothetical protein